jgi:hypothetical protein
MTNFVLFVSFVVKYPFSAELAYFVIPARSNKNT